MQVALGICVYRYRLLSTLHYFCVLRIERALKLELQMNTFIKIMIHFEGKIY